MGIERTYEVSIKNQESAIGSTDTYTILNSYAKTFHKALHSLYDARYYQEIEDQNQLKQVFLKRFQLTARQFNAVKYQLDAQVGSFRECLKGHIKLLKGKIKSVNKWLSKTEKKLKALNKEQKECKPEKKQDIKQEKQPLLFKMHHKKRYLYNLQQKLAKREKLQKRKAPSICFGGRKLFRTQFHLEANKYESHAEWLEDFRFHRSHFFFVLGSKDESMGNQSCQYDPIKKELKLRLTNNLAEKLGEKYLLLKDIEFPYGQKEILDNFIHHFAISFRFIKRKTRQGDVRWYLQAIIDRVRSPSLPELVSNPNYGALGVDINAKHLTMALVNPDGNFKKSWTIKLDATNLSSVQTQERCRLAANRIVEIAEKEKVPIVIEKLDFTKKKETLREQGNGYARMLSAFYYEKVGSSIRGKAEQCGIQVKERNPALSSIIGRLKYATGYRFTTHHGAAVVLARRGLFFSERFRLFGTGLQVVKLQELAEDIVKRASPRSHAWTLWRSLNRKTSNGSPKKESVRRLPKRSSGP